MLASDSAWAPEAVLYLDEEQYEPARVRVPRAPALAFGFPANFPATVIGTAVGRPDYVLGRVAGGGNVVVGTTVASAEPAPTQGVYQLRRAVWQAQPRAAQFQETDAGGVDPGLAVSAAPTLWFSFSDVSHRITWLTTPQASGTPLPNPPSIRAPTSGWRLIDVAFSPSGLFKAVLGTGTEGNSDYAYIWVNQGNSQTAVSSSYGLQTGFLQTTRVRTGTLLLTDLGRASVVYTTEHANWWRVSNDASVRNTFQQLNRDNSGRFRRWHAFCGEECFSGPSSRLGPVVRVAANSHQQVVTAIPERAYLAASGARVGADAFLCLSWLDAAGFVCGLFKNEQQLYQVPGFTMFCVSPSGDALAALQVRTGWVFSGRAQLM